MCSLICHHWICLSSPTTGHWLLYNFFSHYLLCLLDISVFSYFKFSPFGEKKNRISREREANEQSGCLSIKIIINWRKFYSVSPPCASIYGDRLNICHIELHFLVGRIMIIIIIIYIIIIIIFINLIIIVIITIIQS